jgi:peptidyl-tRNA hydrolase
LRIGTGPCPPNRDTKDFVLSGFSPDDKALFSQGLGLALQAALLAVSDGIEKAMNRFNAPAQKECK